MPKRTYELDTETIQRIDTIADNLDGKNKSNVVNRAVLKYLQFVEKGRVNDPYFKNPDPSINNTERK